MFKKKVEDIPAIRFDYYRLEGRMDGNKIYCRFLSDRMFRRLFLFRKVQSSKGFLRLFYRVLARLTTKNLAVELPYTIELGKGVLFLHPYGITINSKSIIGDNFTILKGATIGNSKTGRIGSPTIGNNVYLGLNSTIVGGVTIGNNVMIAANTFVNFDVPDDSVVIGSPGVIHHKENASYAYIYNSIENYI